MERDERRETNERIGARVDLGRLTGADRVVLVSGLVSIVSLVLFPWYVDKGPELSSVTAVESPNSFWGALALVFAVAAVALTLVRRVTDIELPGGAHAQRWDRIVFLLTIVVAGLLVFKLLIDPNRLGFGAWLGVAAGLAMAVGGFIGDGRSH